MVRGFNLMRRAKCLVLAASELGQDNGGKGQYAAAMLQRIVPMAIDQGFDPVVVVPRDAKIPDATHRARVVRLPVGKNVGFWKIFHEQWRYPLAARQTGVFAALGAPFPLTPLGAKRKVAVIHDIHPLQHAMRPAEFPGTYSPRSLWYLKRAIRRTVKTADAIVVGARSVANELVDYAGAAPENIHVVPLGVDSSRFHPVRDGAVLDRIRGKYRLPDRFFLFVGRRDPKKNFALVEKAYSRRGVAADVPPVVVVGGEGTRSQTSTRLSWVHALPFVPDDEMAALYTLADAVLQPSLHEGFGLPALEAMACGTPVVASNQASQPEVVGDGGILIDPRDHQALRAALSNLEDPATRSALSRRGLERARQFTWENTADGLAQILFASEGGSHA